MNCMIVAEPKAFFFPGPLRQPEVIVVANDELEAKTEFRKLAGKTVTPRRVAPILIASPDVQDMLRVQIEGDTPKGIFQTANEVEFPLLSFYGPHSITPSWVVDRSTGKVVISSEFQSLPPELLCLDDKPTPEQVKARGDLIRSSMDSDVSIVNEAMSWLYVEDEGDLRDRLQEECRRWERRYGS